jgi:hypothetical protein
VTPVLLGILGQGAAGAGGTTAFESIATTTVGSGGSSTVTFDLTGVTGYTHLQIRNLFKPTSSSCWMRMRFNSDGGNNYAYHEIRADGSSVIGNADSTFNYSYISLYLQSPVASTFSAGVIDILDYANTNKYKTLRSLNGLDANGSGNMEFVSSLWMSTSAITSIVLSCSGSNSFSEYSHFALYGIKA